jgi:hypothetical protein
MSTGYTQKALDLLARFTDEQREEVLGLLEEMASDAELQPDAAARLQLPRAARGILRGTSYSSEDLAREKAEEKALEDR